MVSLSRPGPLPARPHASPPLSPSQRGPPTIEPAAFPGALRRSNNIGRKYHEGGQALHDHRIVMAMKPKGRDYDMDDAWLKEFSGRGGPMQPANGGDKLSLVQQAQQKGGKGVQPGPGGRLVTEADAYVQQGTPTGKLEKCKKISRETGRAFQAQQRR